MKNSRSTKREASGDPSVHSKNIQHMLSDVIKHVRKDVTGVDEPRFEALLETTAEVLAGLKTAYAHYDRGEEKAWSR